MTSLANWFSPSVMQPLGWTLLNFLWQGMALAALAAGCMAISRRASVRYAVGVGALAVMMAAPAVTFILFWQASPGPALLAPADAPVRIASALRVAASQALPSAAPAVSSLNTLPWLVEAWLIGVALFSLRTAGGFLMIERLRRRQSVPAAADLRQMCFTLQRRLGLDRVVRFCECAALDAPAVIGWFRPVLMLPVTALTGLSEAQLQAVIAHELAHIKRLDSFVNVFQIIAETLLFYHPAVWWLNRRIRAERENCCDDVAISLCGNAVEYARALTLMEEWRSAPVLAMAANRGSLAARIKRLLGMSAGMRGIGLTASALCLTTALLAGNAFVGVAHSSSAAGLKMKFPAFHAFAPMSGRLQSQPAKSSLSKKSPASTKPSPAPEAEAGDETPIAGSYIDGMKSAGLENLTVDELISMKIQNVTPEYVRGMRKLGFELDPDQLIGMRVQNVTPEYVKQMRDAGLSPTNDQVVGMKVQGVTPEYVGAMQALGLKPTADDVIAMKVQDVTPDYARQMHAASLQVSIQQLIGMKVQDVTPEYVKALQAAGLKLDANQIISAKVQEITPEFIESVRKHGFHDLGLDKLIQLKNAGILGPPAEL